MFVSGMAGFIWSMNTFTANLFVMFGSLQSLSLKNANSGVFLQQEIGNQGQKLMLEATFHENWFTEREDLYTKAVLRCLLQFDLYTET